MADAGAAKIILDKELNEESLTSTLNEMLKDKTGLLKMGQNAEKIAVKDVEDKIYKEVEKLI